MVSLEYEEVTDDGEGKKPGFIQVSLKDLRHKIQMAKKHTKRYSTSLIIREMQINIIIRYYLTPIRMAVIKKKSTNKKY